METIVVSISSGCLVPVCRQHCPESMTGSAFDVSVDASTD